MDPGNERRARDSCSARAVWPAPVVTCGCRRVGWELADPGCRRAFRAQALASPPVARFNRPVDQVQRALEVVVNALDRFATGAFEGLEAVAGEETATALLPEPAGWLLGELSSMEWWPAFDSSTSFEEVECEFDGPASIAEAPGDVVLQLMALYLHKEKRSAGYFLDRIQRGHMRALLARFRVLAEGQHGDLTNLVDVEPPPPPRARRRPTRCPACGSRRMARILYGMPMGDEKLTRDLDAGRIVLGGCCVTDDDRSWRCADCALGVYSPSRAL